MRFLSLDAKRWPPRPTSSRDIFRQISQPRMQELGTGCSDISARSQFPGSPHCTGGCHVHVCDIFSNLSERKSVTSFGFLGRISEAHGPSISCANPVTLCWTLEIEIPSIRSRIPVTSFRASSSEGQGQFPASRCQSVTSFEDAGFISGSPVSLVHF